MEKKIINPDKEREKFETAQNEQFEEKNFFLPIPPIRRHRLFIRVYSSKLKLLVT
jgi:hypothetical protein